MSTQPSGSSRVTPWCQSMHVSPRSRTRSGSCLRLAHDVLLAGAGFNYRLGGEASD
jgi:hypothetical protein